MARRERSEDKGTGIRVDTSPDESGPNGTVTVSYEDLMEQHRKALTTQENKWKDYTKSLEEKHQKELKALQDQLVVANNNAQWRASERDEMKARVNNVDKDRAELEDQYLKSLEEVQDSKHKYHRWMAWFFLWWVTVPVGLVGSIIGVVYPLILVYHLKSPNWLWVSGASMAMLAYLFYFLNHTMNHKHELSFKTRDR